MTTRAATPLPTGSTAHGDHTGQSSAGKPFDLGAALLLVAAAPGPWTVVVAIAGLGAYFLVFALVYGPIITPDGARDVEYARHLAALGYDPFAYVAYTEAHEGSHVAPKASYLLYIYLLAALDSVFGASWPRALTLFNVLAQTAFAASTVAIALRAAPSRLTLAAMVAFFLCGFEQLQWVAMTQSDPLFLAVSASALLLACASATQKHSGKRMVGWAATAGLVLLLALIRPTWPPIAAAAAAVAWLAPALRAEPAAARAAFLRLSAAGTAFGVLLLLVAAALYDDPTHMPVPALQAALTKWRAYFVEGAVVLARPETFLDVRPTTFGIASVMFVRLAAFFRFWADGFSTVHQAANVVFHVPLYVFAAIGCWVSVRSPAQLSQFALAAAMASLWWIASVDLFHAATMLDFDWRYRAPAYVALLLLAAVGLHALAANARAPSPNGRPA